MYILRCMHRLPSIARHKTTERDRETQSHSARDPTAYPSPLGQKANLIAATASVIKLVDRAEIRIFKKKMMTEIITTQYEIRYLKLLPR